MTGWAPLLVATLFAVFAAYPWLRVATAKDGAAVVRELRHAATATVVVVGLIWIGWALHHAHALG